MKIGIGTDHRGYVHKKGIIEDAHGSSLEWIDVGCFSPERCDYPEYAFAVIELFSQKLIHKAVLLCGTGVGMAIAANRSPLAFAAVAWNQETARRCVQEDNANILVIPADYVSVEEAKILVQIWLAAHFLEGRYAQRVAMIKEWKK